LNSEGGDSSTAASSQFATSDLDSRIFLRLLRTYGETIMNQAIVKDLQKIFEEEEEDDDLLLLYLLSTRDRTDPIYETRSDQGLYKILIHLKILAFFI
jgi:hypothetical protein